MPRYFAFLRAINVGGRNVTMEALRAHFEAAGMSDVQTFIASGNVIFTSRSARADALQDRIETHLRAALGYEVRTFIRTGRELDAIARLAPFSPLNVKSAKALVVGFLSEPLGAEPRRALMALTTDIDKFHVDGREVYWLCRKRQGESTFSNMVFEKKVGASVTFRGMNTVTKLADRYVRVE